MYFDAVEFGKRVRGLRKAAGMTQEELAQKVGVDRPHITRVENGSRVCSVDLLVELSAVLNTSNDYLLVGRDFQKEQSKSQLLSVINQLTAIVEVM